MANNLGNKETMAQNILYYMEKFEQTRADMCEALKVPYTTFTDWVTAKTYPRIDKIEMMANFFGISKADLVEKRSDPIKEARPNSELHDLIDSLPADKLDEAKSFLDYLRAKSDNS